MKHPNNFSTSEAFVNLNFIASGILGKEPGSKPFLNTVVQLYKNFATRWKWGRRGRIDPEVR